MAPEVGPVARWLPKFVVVAAAAVGIVLIVRWAASDDGSRWSLILGIVLTTVSLPLLLLGIRFWTMSPAERERRLAGAAGTGARLQREVDRSKFAHRSAKRNRDLATRGEPAEALVTLLADGGRANEFHSLVYLEVEVRRSGSDPYPARTGEYVTAAAAGTLRPGAVLQVRVDPSDGQRVAVDWDATLRLP